MYDFDGRGVVFNGSTKTMFSYFSLHCLHFIGEFLERDGMVALLLEEIHKTET